MKQRIAQRVCFALVLATAGCTAEVINAEEQDAEGEKLLDASHDDARLDGSTSAHDAGQAEANAASPDVSDAACASPRRIGDGLVGGDTCWAPPEHYCSQGGGQLLTVGCAPDGSFCCLYSSTCLPCGFVTCNGCRAPNIRPGLACPEACKGEMLADSESQQCRSPVSGDLCF
jgi:hypothetical protein